MRRALLALAAAAALLAPAAGALPLAISPLPGTPDASPDTQISVLGIEAARIRSVQVTGDVSGIHTGALHGYSGRRGASFVLDRPLDQGESVHVVVRIAGRRAVGSSFTVA